MLLFIASLIVLYSAFFIGWRVSRNVPDEVPPARRYVEITIDALMLIMTGLTLYALDQRLLAVLVPVAIIIVRVFVPFTYVYAPATGIILGASMGAAPELQATIILLCLTLNYLLGAAAKGAKPLLLRTLAQPVVAILVAIATLLLQKV
jgi:hypothetical protein